MTGSEAAGGDDESLSRDLWLQVARPFDQAHPEHGPQDQSLLARLWTAEVAWQPEDLKAVPVVVRLGIAPEHRLAAMVRAFGLLPYARALRETLSGSVLKRVERALGPVDWARLLGAEAAVDVLAPDEAESRALADLLVPAIDATKLDLAGVDALAACIAAFGEPWRLRLGLRLRPDWHEAVLAAVPRPRKQAERRLEWAWRLTAPPGSTPPPGSGSNPHSTAQPGSTSMADDEVPR